MKNTVADLIDEALSILLKERSILISGKLEELPSIQHEKVRLFGVMSDVRSAMNKDNLDILSSELKRNESLLQFSLQGMNLAKFQVSEIRGAFSKLTTYGDDGRTITYSTAKSSTSFKA